MREIRYFEKWLKVLDENFAERYFCREGTQLIKKRLTRLPVLRAFKETLSLGHKKLFHRVHRG